MHIKWDDIVITGDPLILSAQIGIILTMLAVVVGVTYFKKWQYLWDEWITTVDHKKSVSCILLLPY